MIVGGRIDAVEGKKNKDEQIKGLSINISLDDVRVKGEDVEIVYTYTADYAEGVGQLKIKGTLFAKEDKKQAKELADAWKKDKKVPQDYANGLLTTINYSGSANGTLVARVVNLSPPLVPPRLQLGTKKK